MRRATGIRAISIPADAGFCTGVIPSKRPKRLNATIAARAGQAPRELVAGADVRLRVHVAEVVLNRLGRQEELLGDLAVGLARHDEPRDDLLSRRQAEAVLVVGVVCPHAAGGELGAAADEERLRAQTSEQLLRCLKRRDRGPAARALSQ